MKKTFSVYVSPLEMDSSLGRLTDLPIEQEKLNGLRNSFNEICNTIRYRCMIWAHIPEK